MTVASMVDLDYYLELDSEIDAAEDDGIRKRWQFGRALLAERVGKLLPRGRLDEVAEVIGKSRTEIKYRMLFAERFPTEVELANAVDQFGSWHAVVNEAMASSANDAIGTDEYFTPRWIFDALDLRFDLDVAAPAGGAPAVPADRYYDTAADGLTQPWAGRVWMNPPYSDPGPWVELFLRHGHGIALLPFAKSGWFFDLWHRLDVTFVAPGVAASRFDGGQIYMPTFLAAIGPPEVHDAVKRLGRAR